jgi:hypothetical protein
MTLLAITSTGREWIRTLKKWFIFVGPVQQQQQQQSSLLRKHVTRGLHQ